MTTTDTTPGFNTRIAIYFDHDKHGRKIAYRWSRLAGRAIRMSLTDAELFIAQDQADLIDGHPMRVS